MEPPGKPFWDYIPEAIDSVLGWEGGVLVGTEEYFSGIGA